MGACSSRPKTSEFEGNMNIYLQEELARKNLDDEQKGGCNGGLKSSDPEQKISSKCSLQNLQPAMENGVIMGDVLVELEKERLAGSSPENGKETCARPKGTCDAKHHVVAERESQVPKIGTDNAKLQKVKNSVAQELYEEPAFAQKEDVLGSLRNLILFEEEVVVESPQNVAFRDVEKGKFQTLESINEDIELPTFEGGKPRIDSEEGNPIQEPVFLASRVATVDFKLNTNPAGNLTNCRIEKTEARSASTAANGTSLLHNGNSGDTILEKPSEPEGLVYGAQRHDLEQAYKGQSAPLIVSKTQDSEWTNLKFMVTRPNGPLVVKEDDVSFVVPPALKGLPELTALSNGSLRGIEIEVDEFAGIDLSPSVLKLTGKGADKQVKEAHMATGMSDELSCHLPNFTELPAKHSTSRDENLGIHETEKPLTDLVNTKVEDDSMASKLGNGASDMIRRGEDSTQVGLKKGCNESFSVAATTDSIITEALDSQTPSLSKVRKQAITIKGEGYASKQELDLILCQDEIKVFKVVDMSKEQVIDYERHSAAFLTPQTFEELHVVEPPRSIYGKDMASDIDEVLEKLASEFERQESLSSLLP